MTLIGDEPYQPYDRPPLSKQVLTGWVPAEHTTLPRLQALGDVEWRLGVSATGLDLTSKHVRLADGQQVGFDRLLIATGTRARPWPNEAQAALDGVCVLRSCDDASRLQQRLAAGPGRVLVIGAGFTGSEIASVCRELGLPVTVTERGASPLVGALGGMIGAIAAQTQRQHGVDLRCGVTVNVLEGDANGRLRRAHLSDESTLDVDVAVVALGAVRNTEWLDGSGLAAGFWGVVCDAGRRAMDSNGIITDDVFVAGDVARFPHPLYDYQLLALEHWGNAVEQAEIAAHNMLSAQSDRRPHISVPAFWSIQFGVNIKSVGVPSFADEVVIMQGSVQDRRFVAAYGHRGRAVAAVTFNQAKWLPFYQELIETEYLEQLRPEIVRIVTTLLDRVLGQRQIDLVERFAYPLPVTVICRLLGVALLEGNKIYYESLPVTVICRLLGVPLEDEPEFGVWASSLAESLAGQSDEQRRQRELALNDLNQYMVGLVERHRKQPGDDLLSGLATDTGPEGRMEDPYLVATAALLLFAGHETTVNLLSNGMLTLLRHPAILERLRHEPDLIPATVEELLRYEPPLQFLNNRTTLDEIALAGTTIPKGVVTCSMNRHSTAGPGRGQP